MGVVERTAFVAAQPRTIWQLYAPMKWTAWDPDVVEVEDVRNGGLAEGGSAVMTMGTGQKFTAVFGQVKENEYFEMKAKMAFGMVGGFMSQRLEAREGGTHLTYVFGLTGPLGWLARALNNKAVVDGTEGGLKNLKEMAETAEINGVQT